MLLLKLCVFNVNLRPFIYQSPSFIHALTKRQLRRLFHLVAPKSHRVFKRMIFIVKGRIFSFLC